MRYLLNIPLLLAIASSFGVVYLAMLAEPHGNGDAQLGAAYAMAFGTGFAWLMFAVVLVGCAGIGAFTWLPEGRFEAVFITLLLSAGIALVAFIPTSISLDARGGAASWTADQVWMARLVFAGLPTVLAAYLAWVINAPETLGDAVTVNRIAIGAVVVLSLLGSVVAFREFARWDAATLANARAAQAAEAEAVQEKRRAFAALTDADPLLTWWEYTGYNNTTDDMRAEALRRMAARPTLEQDLAEALASANTNWTREALGLITRIPFTPTSSLEAPVRNALAVIIAELRQRATVASFDGDKAIDYYEQSTLQRTLAVARRLAETAHVDLRDRLDEMQQAVAAFPKSDAARQFPAEVGEAKKAIVRLLAAQQT